MELAVHQNKIINTFDKIGGREKSRASEAGEDREEIGAMLELTGLNKKAVSFCRMLHKQEPEKREDIIRSLKPLLDLMEAHWDGQSTPDMFTEPAEPADDLPESPDADFDAQMAEALDDHDPAYDGDDPETAEESEKFLADVDANMGDAA